MSNPKIEVSLGGNHEFDMQAATAFFLDKAGMSVRWIADFRLANEATQDRAAKEVCQKAGCPDALYPAMREGRTPVEAMYMSLKTILK
jgi:hypothetical protein